MKLGGTTDNIVRPKQTRKDTCTAWGDFLCFLAESVYIEREEF